MALRRIALVAKQAEALAYKRTIVASSPSGLILLRSAGLKLLRR